MKHVLLAEAIDQMIEAKKKDHDKDGDIDSDDYLAARDKAIKKAMGKDKKDESVKEELTDKQKKLPAQLQKAIAKKQGDKPADKVEEKVTSLKALLEQEVEKAEIVIAAKSLVDELQDMIEQMGKMQNDELGAVVDPNVYRNMVQIRRLYLMPSSCNTIRNITCINKIAQEAVNNEVLVLTGEAPTSEMGPVDSDLGTMDDDEAKI